MRRNANHPPPSTPSRQAPTLPPALVEVILLKMQTFIPTPPTPWLPRAFQRSTKGGKSKCYLILHLH